MKSAFLALLVLSFFAAPVYAHCPLCSAATGAAVATARFYGVDNIIIGTFMGAFVISTGLWINNMLRKRNKQKDYLSFQLPAILLLSFASTIAAFYFAGILHVDKLLAGTISGSIITTLAFWSHNEFRKMNNNRNYLPLQGLILPFAFVIMLNAIFYALGFI